MLYKLVSSNRMKIKQFNVITGGDYTIKCKTQHTAVVLEIGLVVIVCNI